MPVINATNLSLLDWSARLDPDGKTSTVAELLSQTNEILLDAVFVEGNLPTGHRVTVRTGLPVVYWRALNVGVPLSKSTTAQVDESCGMLEAYSEVDKDLALLNGNSAAFRTSEDMAFLEAMNQEQARVMFYGNPGVDPKQYLGLAPRYSAISGAGNAQNIIAGGSVAANVNTSIWLVVWGESTVFCPFPKGSKAGLIHEDLGEDTIVDANGGRLQALRTRYQWKNGLVVRDWRYVVRVCNINVTNLVAESSAANLIKLMARALDRIPSMGMGRPVFYCNRTVHSMLRIQALNNSTNAMGVQQALQQFGGAASGAAGGGVSFLGVPVRRVDQILNTEALVA